MPTRSQVLGYLQDVRDATPQDPVTNVQIADYLESLLDLVVADGVTKTTPIHYGTAKGLEIWATGGAAWGVSSTFLEASIKSKTFGTGEIEFWNLFLETDFTFRDGGPRTERFKLKAGHAWLPGNMHVGVGTDRTNKGLALWVGGNVGFGTVSGNTAKVEIESGPAEFSTALLVRPSTHATSRRAVIQFGNWQLINDVNANGGSEFALYNNIGASIPIWAGASGHLFLNNSVGDTVIGSLGNNGLGKLQVIGATYSSLSVTSDEMFFVRKNGASIVSNTFYQQNISGGTTYAMNMQMTPTGGIGFWTFNAGWANRIIIKDTGAVRFVPLSAAPSSPENGDTYYDSTLGKIRVYAAGAWANLH